MSQNKNRKQANPYLSGVLAVWILLLSFAGVSPALHSWLHGSLDSKAETCESGECSDQLPQSDAPNHPAEGTHICGVTTLHAGALLTLELSTPPIAVLICGECPICDETAPCTSAAFHYQSRAPPIESLV